MSLRERLRQSGVSIAVLCGGPGGEREVSLASGGNVHNALTRAGLPNEMVVVPEHAPERFLEDLDCGLAVMMLHGRFGEDGTAQAILERRGIAYTGSEPEACALAMDKDRSKVLFVEKGIPTPRWVHVDAPGAAEGRVEEEGLRYPLFVKPNRGGSSVCTSRVSLASELPAAVRRVVESGDSAMIEEMVVGRELTVGWLDGETLPVIEMAADGDFYDYHAKYLSEKTRYTCPANLPDALAGEIALIARNTAGCVGVRDLSRVDVMLGADGPRVLELNALPGFTEHSLLPMAAAAAGIDIGQLCIKLAAMAALRAGII